MKTNLLKTFLLAALMVVGGQAWGNEKTYTTIWEKDFEDAETFTADMTVAKSRSQAAYTVTQFERTDINSKAYNLYNSSYGSNVTLTVSGINAFSANDYLFSMDFALTAPNNSETSLNIKDANGNSLFRTAITVADQGRNNGAQVQSPIYINGSSNAETETVTINTFRGGALAFYNILISSNANDGTHLSLYSYNSTGEKSLVKTYTINEGYLQLGSIYGGNGTSSYGSVYLDNLSFGSS